MTIGFSLLLSAFEDGSKAQKINRLKKIQNMKKTILLLILSVGLFDLVMADGSSKQRSGCPWWRKRFVADASATEFWVGPRIWSRSCDNAYSYAESGGSHAKAEAKANWSEVWDWEWTDRWFASAGESNPTGSFDINEIPENTKSFKEHSTKLEGVKIDHNSGTVYISSLSSKLDISSDDPLNDFAAFRISIVLEDVEDTLVPPIILEDNKAFFINGQLYLEGNFFKAVKFTEIPSAFEGGKAYSLEVGQFIFMNRVEQGKEIAIYTSGDVGNLRLGTPDKFITAEAKNLYVHSEKAPNLFLFPNPVVANSTIMISGLENYQGSLTVVDMQGNLILDLGNISVANKEDEVSIPFNTNGLQPKNYYLLLSSGSKRSFLRFKKE